MRALLVAFVLIALATPAHADGVTVEAGFGIGLVGTDPFGRWDGETYGGSVAAGVWLTPRTALTGRLVLHTYGEVKGDDSLDTRYWLVGPSVQHWLTDWAWVSGGVGLAVYQESSDGNDFTSSAGAGLDLRIAVSPPLGSRHRVALWIEAIPAFFVDTPRSTPPPPVEWDTFLSATINVGYQLR